MTLAMLTATGIAEQWISQVLGGDATLGALATGGIYSGDAPQGTSYPFLTFSYVSGKDVDSLGPTRMMSRLWYDLAARIDQRSIVGLDAIMARADFLLQGKQAVLPGGYQLGSQRIMPPKNMASTDAGKSYRALIATYELFVSEGHG